MGCTVMGMTTTTSNPPAALHRHVFLVDVLLDGNDETTVHVGATVEHVTVRHDVEGHTEYRVHLADQDRPLVLGPAARVLMAA